MIKLSTHKDILETLTAFLKVFSWRKKMHSKKLLLSYSDTSTKIFGQILVRQASALPSHSLGTRCKEKSLAWMDFEGQHPHNYRDSD